MPNHSVPCFFDFFPRHSTLSSCRQILLSVIYAVYLSFALLCVGIKSKVEKFLKKYNDQCEKAQTLMKTASQLFQSADERLASK